MKEDLNFQVSSMFTKATLKSISDSYRRVKITIT
jgi:hypothetical protein